MTSRRLLRSVHSEHVRSVFRFTMRAISAFTCAVYIMPCKLHCLMVVYECIYKYANIFSTVANACTGLIQSVYSLPLMLLWSAHCVTPWISPWNTGVFGKIAINVKQAVNVFHLEYVPVLHLWNIHFPGWKMCFMFSFYTPVIMIMVFLQRQLALTACHL